MNSSVISHELFVFAVHCDCNRVKQSNAIHADWTITSFHSQESQLYNALKVKQLQHMPKDKLFVMTIENKIIHSSILLEYTPRAE